MAESARMMPHLVMPLQHGVLEHAYIGAVAHAELVNHRLCGCDLIFTGLGEGGAHQVWV